MGEFKVGDRVRATLGDENMLVGKAAAVDSTGVYIKLFDHDGGYLAWYSDGWRIEKVSPPLPTKVGAIVRTAGMNLRVLTDELLWYLVDGEGTPYLSGQDLAQPIEVIFDGVDQ